MKTKKTWFSYLTWFIFSVFTGVLFAVYLSAFGAAIWQLNKYGTAFLICTAFALCAGIWFLGRKIWELTAERLMQDAHLIRMWEYFLVMCIFAGAVLYRISLLFNYSGNGGGGIFYEMAAVKASGGIPGIAHGASYIYTAVLSFLFSFAGNKVITGIFLQLVLQAAAIVTFYFAVRILAGRVEAFCVAAVMGFLPVLGQQIFSLSPEPLYLLLYSAGLLFLGLYALRKSSAILFALIGIYIGIMGYLDIIGWTLLLFALFVSIRKAAADKGTAIGDVFLKMTLILLSSAIGMMACTVSDAVFSGESVGNILSSWWNNYAGAGWQMPETGGSMLLVSILICACAAFGVIGFWFHKDQKQDAWILLLTVILFLDMFHMGQMEYRMLGTAVFGVLAGIGITSVGMDERKPEKEKRQELIIEEITLDENEENGAENIREGSAVKYIDNPLPLPKKHVKKEMDYDRAIEDMAYEFDITINESDDFDI